MTRHSSKFQLGDVVIYKPANQFVGLIIDRQDVMNGLVEFKVMWYKQAKRNTESDDMFIQEEYLTKIGHIEGWRTVDSESGFLIEVYY